MALTSERLRSLGVDQPPEMIEALLYRAITRAFGPHPATEPQHELTPTEAAVLERGGVARRRGPSPYRCG